MPKIYHYTDSIGYEAIKKAGVIRMSWGPGGEGVYFTGLPPIKTSHEDLAFNNYRKEDPKSLERTKYWFEFNSEDFPKIVKMDWGARNVWVNPGNVKL